jgi:hypothetical protein
MPIEKAPGDQMPIDPKNNPTPKPAASKKKRGLVLKIVGGVITALVLLVLGAPTLVSTRPMLAIILSQVNDKLNGHVEIASLSLGWFSGVKVEGVRVFDSSKSQIAELDRLVVPIPLWKALTGKLALGDVVCEGLSVDARYDAQHQLNFAQLVKQSPGEPAAAGPGTPSVAAEPAPTKLPDISGSVKLINCRATVSEPGKPTVFIGNVNGLVSIPNMNSMITDSLGLTLRTGDGQPGSLNISGTAAAIRQNCLALDSAEIHQKIDLADLDLQTAMPFIPASVGVDTLQGTLAVHISVDVADGKNAAIDASITGKKPISIGGRVLKGDTFKTDTFIAAIPKLSAVFPDGLDKWQSGRVKVGADAGAAPVLFKVDQGQVTMQVDQQPQAILNLTHNEKPGSAGQLLVESAFDLAKIIPQLRNTIGMPPHILLQSGAFTQKLALTTTPDVANFSNTIDTTSLAGTDASQAGALRPISIDPVHLSLSTEDRGGGGAIPDLRSVKLTLASKSINGQFQGATLANLNGTLTADLTGAMNEVKQFLPASKLSVAGNLDVKVGETGSLDQAPYQSTVTLNVSGNGLQYSSDGTATSTEPMLQLDLAADLQGSVAGAIQAMPKSLLTLKTSRIQTPITVAVTNAAFAPAAKSVLDQLQSAHLQIDVPDLKSVSEEASAFSSPPPVSAKQSPPPVQLAAGSFSMAGDLSHDATGLQINLNNIAGRDIAFSQGSAVYPAGPIDLKLLVGIQTQAGKSIANQLANINVKLAGNVAQFAQLAAASEGEKPDAYPYRGDLTANENVSLHPNTVALDGGVQIAKFQSCNGNTITFSEDSLAIGNDVSLSTVGDDESVAINSLNISMQSSGALNIALKNGSIHHLQTTRAMQLQPTMDYDLAKLWPIVQPMMGDKYKTLKATGQFKKQFNISGSYPAGEPSTVAIKTLHADGDLAVAMFDYDGLNLQNFTVPFTLDNGKVMTVFAGKPVGQNTAPPAVANGGALDLGDLTVDLTQDPPRLNVPPNKLLISKLTINPLFSKSFLAKYLNNPLFTGNNNATGLLDLTMVDCTALPLGNLVTAALPANTGKADVKFSLSGMHIGFAGISGLASALKQDSIAANVKDGTVSIAKGLSTEHISFVSGDYSLNFDGAVRLADDAMVPLNLSVGPLAVIVQRIARTHDKNVLKYLPDRANVQVEGTVGHASVRLDKALEKLLKDAGLKAIGKGLLGGDKNGNGNSVGGFLKGL